MKSFRMLILICAMLMLAPASMLRAQLNAPNSISGMDYTRTSWFPNIFDAYSSPRVPQQDMNNPKTLRNMVQDGKLRISLREAIELALENNLEIDIARFQPAYSQTDLVRAQSGQATRGVAGAFESPSLFSGALGGGIGGGGGAYVGGAGGITGGGGATNIGSFGSFDPVVGFGFGWDQRLTPLGTTVVTGVPYLNTQTSNMSGFLGQEFPTGTSYLIGIGGFRQSSTSLTNIFDPEVVSGLTLGFNQHLLKGFGYRSNGRFIRIARNNSRIADSVFKQRVSDVLAKVLDSYWDLEASHQNVEIARQSLAFTQKLVTAPTAGPAAQVLGPVEVASGQQVLIGAETHFEEEQTNLKELLARKLDSFIASVELEPVDTLPDPDGDGVPALDAALDDAQLNRPEIKRAQINLQNQDVVVKASRNNLLPRLDLFGTYRAAGLSGNRLVGLPTTGLLSDPGLPIVRSGWGQAINQLFLNDYPDYSFGISLSFPIRNRAAQADAARALVEQRELKAQYQNTQNAVAKDVINSRFSLIQEQKQYDAAHHAVILADQALSRVQKTYLQGQASFSLLLQAQQELARARQTELEARLGYAKALTHFEQATGTVLSSNQISFDHAEQAHLSLPENIPAPHIESGM
jgi:outer membrane protein